MSPTVAASSAAALWTTMMGRRSRHAYRARAALATLASVLRVRRLEDAGSDEQPQGGVWGGGAHERASLEASVGREGAPTPSVRRAQRRSANLEMGGLLRRRARRPLGAGATATNRGTEGRASADRGNRATLPRTIPRSLFKSSARDSSARVRELWSLAAQAVLPLLVASPGR